MLLRKGEVVSIASGIFDAYSREGPFVATQDSTLAHSLPRPYLLLRKLGKSPNCFGSFLGCFLSKVSLSSYLVDEFTWGHWVTLS